MFLPVLAARKQIVHWPRTMPCYVDSGAQTEGLVILHEHCKQLTGKTDQAEHFQQTGLKRIGPTELCGPYDFEKCGIKLKPPGDKIERFGYILIFGGFFLGAHFYLPGRVCKTLPCAIFLYLETGRANSLSVWGTGCALFCHDKQGC